MRRQITDRRLLPIERIGRIPSVTQRLEAHGARVDHQEPADQLRGGGQGVHQFRHVADLEVVRVAVAQVVPLAQPLSEHELLPVQVRVPVAVSHFSVERLHTWPLAQSRSIVQCPDPLKAVHILVVALQYCVRTDPPTMHSAGITA